MTKRAFFNQFGSVFSTYRTSFPSKFKVRAWKRFKTPQKKYGKAKTPYDITEVRVEATWDVSTPTTPIRLRVDTLYLDANGEETARGRGKNPKALEDAFAEAEARVGKLQ